MDKNTFGNLLYCKLLENRISGYFDCESYALHITRYQDIAYWCNVQAGDYINGIRDSRIHPDTLRLASQIESNLRVKVTSCGCCTGTFRGPDVFGHHYGCVCQNHMDIPNGVFPGKCNLHR